jgi:hydrocephalus-inducing protein
VNIKNGTNKAWRISPAISTPTENFWTGAAALEIPAGGSVDYEILYHPMTMTNQNEHEGTLFFPLPDGTALLYNLFGVSAPPKPAQVVESEVKAKQAHIQVLRVENWLKIGQRFNVQWEIEGE